VDWSDPNRRASLVRRGEQSNRTKDGMIYQGLVDRDRVKQAGLTLWEWSVGKKYWAVVPYLVGPNDPEVLAGRLQVGEGTYTSGVYFHRHGPNGMDKIVCLSKTFGQPCPFCEYRQWLDGQDATTLGMTDQALDDLIKSLLPSRYAAFLYYIIDWDAEGKGLQVAEISGLFFEQALQRQAYSERGGGYIAFMDPGAGPDGGRDIEFEIKGSKAKQDWGRGVAFRERRAAIPNHYLDKAAELSLDELWNIPDYQTAYDACWQGQQPPWEQGQQGDQGGRSDPQQAQHYECFCIGQYGSFQDCTTTCPDGGPQGECIRGGVVEGFRPVEEPDIPSNPALQPQPEPVREPVAAPPEQAKPPKAPPRTLPPRGGGAGASVGGKPPLLRRGQ